MDGESGREIRISLKVDFVGLGDGEKRISDRLGERRDAIVINGGWEALTLIIAFNKKIWILSSIFDSYSTYDADYYYCLLVLSIDIVDNVLVMMIHDQKNMNWIMKNLNQK